MKTLFITFFLMGIAFVCIAIRILFKKNGTFQGTCASQNPITNKAGAPCGFCGKMPEHCEK